MRHGTRIRKFKEYFADYTKQGEQIDTKNIKKHKNDVFRLLAYVSPTSRIQTAEEIEFDIIQFIEKIKEDQPDLKTLGKRRTSLDECWRFWGIFSWGRGKGTVLLPLFGEVEDVNQQMVLEMRYLCEKKSTSLMQAWKKPSHLLVPGT